LLPGGLTMLNVICYMQPHRSGGIGRHGVEMARRLLRRPDVGGKLLASHWQVRNNPAFAAEMAGLPIETHWLPEMMTERMWKLLSWPPFPADQRGFDCIYGPAEVRFPRAAIPNIVTVHDAQAFETELPWSRTFDHRLFQAKWRFWIPKVCREASCIATVSEFSKQRLSEFLQIDPSRFAVIGNGISDVFFHQEPVPLSARTTSVVIIGGLRTKKGAAATLAVAERLRRISSPLTLDVFGQHDRDWARRADAHPNVRLHPYVGDAELAIKLKSAVALLFLSLYEGFGIPAIEAMAAGTPAVVANRASLPEVVADAGVVVDDRDAEHVAEVLESLRCDHSLRDDLIRKGRHRAEHFTWDACVERLVETMTRLKRSSPHPVSV
jgi:glycosyltransferase involved in cell wall biosynthesis